MCVVEMSNIQNSNIEKIFENNETFLNFQPLKKNLFSNSNKNNKSPTVQSKPTESTNWEKISKFNNMQKCLFWSRALILGKLSFISDCRGASRRWRSRDLWWNPQKKKKHTTELTRRTQWAAEIIMTSNCSVLFELNLTQLSSNRGSAPNRDPQKVSQRTPKRSLVTNRRSLSSFNFHYRSVHAGRRFIYAKTNAVQQRIQQLVGGNN